MREQESHRESVLQMLEQVNSQIQNLNTLQEQMPSHFNGCGRQWITTFDK